MIILNEKKWVEDVLRDKDLGKRPYDTITRVARYYGQCKGYNRKQIREELDKFLVECSPDVVLVKWDKALEKASKEAGKYPMICVDGVDITKSELDVISKLDGLRMQRFAFVLLCIAKYWNAARGVDRNKNWVNTDDSELLRMANVTVTIKKESVMLHELMDAGLISFSKMVDNLNIQVLFADYQSKSVLRICDFRNLGYQYSMYSGGPYNKCADCGITYHKNGNKSTYCPECAERRHKEQSRLYSERRRALRNEGVSQTI